ncbi:MAG: hypothetical protein ACR2PM_20930 [Hyphomicrobiales bacterium]
MLTLVPIAATILIAIGATALVMMWAGAFTDNRPEFREGVRINLSQASWVRVKLLSPAAPIEIGYAETGKGCHVASGALLLRSRKVRRVLSTIVHPVCGAPAKDKVLRSIAPDKLRRRGLSYTPAFWLERSGGAPSNDALPGAAHSTVLQNTVRVSEGRPWPKGFMINCDRDSSVYSLRTLFPDPFFGGSKFGSIATVRFRRGACMDPRHWPKIEALIDLIWSLETYKYRNRKTRD